MTTVVARRPTSTTTQYNMGIFGGSPTIHAAVADTDDTTFVRLFNPADGTWRFKVAFATATITADQYVARYRIRMRIAYDNPGIAGVPVVANWKAYLIGSNGTTVLTQPDHYTSVFFGQQDPFTVIGAWRQPIKPRAWDSTDLVTPSVELIGFTANDNHFPRIMGIWLEHEVRNRPTTTVSAPTGSQTVTTAPATIFTYASLDSVPVSGYQVKIFTAAQYGAAGFNADTSASTVDSGVVRPSGLIVPLEGYRPPVPLANGVTFKSYVQVRNAGTFSSFYVPKSDWVASPAFSLNVTDPAVPVITAVANDPRAQIDVTVQSGQNMLTYDGSSFEVGTGGWTAHLNCAIARVTSKSADGVASLRLTATAGGDMTAAGPFILVETAKVYSARAQVTANATTRSCRVGIDWYNAAFGLISSSNGSSVAETGTTFPGVTPVVTSVTAPALAVYARVTVTILAAAAAEIHYTDKVSMKPLADVTWTRGGLSTEQYIDIWRSLAGGEWVLVVDRAVLSDFTQLYLYEDGSVPNGVSASYKAKTTSIDPTTPDDPLSSAESSATSPITMTIVDWWIRDLEVPADSIQVSLDMETFRYIEHEEQARYTIIGRKNLVVVRDVINGISAGLKLDFLTWTALQAFLKIRNKQKTLLLKSPLAVDQQWYFTVQTDVEINLHPSAPDLYCTASMEILEQDVPTP